MHLITKKDVSKKSKYLKLHDYVTYQIITNVQFNSIKYILNFLKEEFSNHFIEALKGMIKFKNQKGVVF